MTELIYYQDQYKKQLDAKILKVEDNKILLDKTIFIPETNTEPGDFGKINGLEISGSVKNGNDVWHVFSESAKFQEGDVVKLELDWNKRFLSMRLHSALHLLASVFDKIFGKRAVAGAVREQAYLIFKEEIPEEIIKKAFDLANKDVEAELEIKSYWDEKREGFRWTQIGHYFPIPDGGLHVKNTKEIGKIRLVSKEMEHKKQKIFISVY